MSKSRRGILGGAIGLGLSIGLLHGRAAAQETVTHGYDALGRVVSVTYADGVTITYSYDAAGNRTQVVQGTPPPPPPPPPPLAATASVSTWNWTWDEPADPVVPPPVNVSVTGGAPPYVYLWQWVSGDVEAMAVDGAGSSTTFERLDYPYGPPPKTSYWRCRVTDIAGATAYTVDVIVRFLHTS